jgi:molybdopterin/thiamine biosynthesis adenylyltransferase
MVKFDQGEMERQVCFVMGTGGLGQSVAFALARLGVAKIILLDMDNYEATNLNRQILGSGAQLLHWLRGIRPNVCHPTQAPRTTWADAKSTLPR